MDLATLEHVQALRPLPEPQQARMRALLGRASRLIRSRWPNVDARIASGSLDKDAVADVVVTLALSAFAAPDNPNVTRHDKTAGPFRESIAYSSSGAGMVITADMERLFNGSARVGWLA